MIPSRGFGPAFIFVAFTLTACSPGGQAGANSNSQDASASSPESNITATRETPPCPPEQLSCGVQQPVVSDGTRRFENAEMGLSAVFPRGSRVCLARSGDAPRGFYAWYGTSVTDCPERGDIAAARMAVSAAFNALFHRSVEEAAGRCRPISRAIVRRLASTDLGFPGHRSIACQEAAPDGRIEITVHALAGRFPDDPQGAPYVIYSASLGTSPERLDRDLDMFRTFLGRIRIGQSG